MKSKQNQQAGIATFTILAVIVAVLAIGGSVAYFVSKDSSDSTKKSDEATSIAQNNETSDDQDSDNDDKESLPAGFPSNVPIYEPSSLSSVNEEQAGEGADTTYIVALRTYDEGTDVKAFYDEALSSNGWQIDATQNDGMRYSAKNGEMIITVGISDVGNVTIITLTV